MVTGAGGVFLITRGQCGQHYSVLPTLPTLAPRVPHMGITHSHKQHMRHTLEQNVKENRRKRTQPSRNHTRALSSAPDRCPMTLNKSPLPLCLFPALFCCSLFVGFPPNKNAHPPMTPANRYFMVPGKRTYN